MPHSPETPTPPALNAPFEFTWEELSKHRGNWVAFSADGRRLVASTTTLAALEVLVRTAGENPEEVLLEWIPEGESVRSGMELS